MIPALAGFLFECMGAIVALVLINEARRAPAIIRRALQHKKDCDNG